MFRSAIMLNLNQLKYTIDSLQKIVNDRKETDATRILSTGFEKSKVANVKKDSIFRVETRDWVVDVDSLFAEFDPEEQQRAVASGLEYALECKGYYAE